MHLSAVIRWDLWDGSTLVVAMSFHDAQPEILTGTLTHSPSSLIWEKQFLPIWFSLNTCMQIRFHYRLSGNVKTDLAWKCVALVNMQPFTKKWLFLYILWGIIKDLVSAQHPRDVDQLKNLIEQEVRSVNNDTDLCSAICNSVLDCYQMCNGTNDQRFKQFR